MTTEIEQVGGGWTIAPALKRSESITSLASKVSDVIGEVGAIAHDAKNIEQGYQYTSYDAIAGRLRPMLAKRKLALFVNEVGSSDRKMQTKYKEWDVLRVILDFTIVDGESGEWITVRVSGEGADAGDKQIPKAYTMAQKYLFKMLFLISTGADDAEADAAVDKAVLDHDIEEIFGPETKKEHAGAKESEETKKAVSFAKAMNELTIKMADVLKNEEHPSEEANLRMMRVLGTHGFTNLAEITSSKDRHTVHDAWDETVEAARVFAEKNK